MLRRIAQKAPYEFGEALKDKRVFCEKYHSGTKYVDEEVLPVFLITSSRCLPYCLS